jgi:large subunit ribosomal protein L1
MGKVKIRVVGDEKLEQEQKEEQKKRREAKSAAGGKAKVAGVGLGGGQRIQAVGVSEEEIAKELEKTEASEVSGVSEVSKGTETVKKAKSKSKTKTRVRSKRYRENSSVVAGKTIYPVTAGIEVLRKFKKGNFDETVELHINTREKGISGQVNLPHGTGKKLRISIADDSLIARIEKGKIDFDILVAEPAMMPKLAKVARVLGPRGLMPNPKSGTISENPSQAVKQLSSGQVSYKTESQAPIIHMPVGKLSFDDKMLFENITAVLSAIGSSKISGVTLKSTMSPAIRLQT